MSVLYWILSQEDNSEWLELVITKEECSIAEAYAILNLTLVGEVNSTSGQLGYINEYDSVHRSAPELMNLAGDILHLIPLKDLNLRNDKTGSKPKEFDERVKEIVESFVRFLGDLIVAIGNVIANVVEKAVKVELKVVEVIREAAMAVLEAMMNGVLKAYINIMVALEIFYINMGLLSLFAVLYPITQLQNEKINLKYLYLKFTLFSTEIVSKVSIEWKYQPFFDMDFPYSKQTLLLNNQIFFSNIESIIDLRNPIDFNDDSDDLLSLNSEDSKTPEVSSENNDYEELSENEISAGNTKITNMKFTPEKGDTNTKFKFSLIYKNSEGKEPESLPNLKLYKNRQSDSELLDATQIEELYFSEGNEDDYDEEDYIEGVEFCVEFKIKEIGSYDFKIDWGEIQSEYMEGPTVQFPLMKIVNSIIKGIDRVFSYISLSLAIIGGAAKIKEENKATALAYAGLISFLGPVGFFNFGFLTKDDYSPDDALENIGMVIACLISWRMIKNMKEKGKYTKTEAENKTTQESLLNLMSFLFTYLIDYIETFIDNVIIETILRGLSTIWSYIVLRITTKISVALIWGKHGAPGQKPNTAQSVKTAFNMFLWSTLGMAIISLIIFGYKLADSILRIQF